jgi:hypothetical protein
MITSTTATSTTVKVSIIEMMTIMRRIFGFICRQHPTIPTFSPEFYPRVNQRVGNEAADQHSD